MKPEPLTNLRGDLELKTKEANEELEILLNTLLTGGTDNKEEALELIFNLLEEFRNEIRQDIKSAVQWLLEEIEKEKDKIENDRDYACKESDRLLKKMGEDIGYDESLADLKALVLEELKQKIKKAFSGVIEG